MPRYIAILFALPLFFAGCEIYNKHKPTEFFKIEEEWLESYNTDTKKHFISGKLESFVLSNPPNDSSLLKKIVEEYNKQTIPLDTIKKYKSVEREFYKETECLTRNYEEGEPYPKSPWWDFNCSFYYDGDDPGQQVRYHYLGEGYLMNTEHAIYPEVPGYLYYTYEFGRKAFGDTVYKRIKMRY